MPRFFLSLMAACLLAQDALTNEGVIKMVKAGLSEDLILSAIADQRSNFSLAAIDLIALKEAGVSEKILKAMMAKGRGASAAPSAATETKPPEASQAAAISGDGVFYKKGAGYFELLTEEIRWKTSGAMKSFASAGIIKKDLGGTVAGPSSRNFLQNPLEIILAPPQGMSINSYLLLPLKALSKGEREFLVGPVNAKSGVAKGAIAFGVEKVGPNQFRLVLQTPLGPGEYGILPVMPASAGPAGKLYTFRLLL
jgi:hypothetical protein